MTKHWRKQSILRKMQNKTKKVDNDQCKEILQKIKEKYPEATNVVENSLKDILNYYEKGENLESPYITMKVVFKGKAKPLPYIEEYE